MVIFAGFMCSRVGSLKKPYREMATEKSTLNAPEELMGPEAEDAGAAAEVAGNGEILQGKTNVIREA